MITTEQIFSVLERKRLELGLSQTEVSARAFGRAENSALQGIRRGAMPSVQKLEALAKALGLEFRFGEPSPASLNQPSMVLDGADYAHIPVHEASLSAGPGVDNGRSNISDHLAFRRDWLQRIGVQATKACLARVTGHSMEPTLWPGDMVLIDQAKTDPVIRKRSETDLRRAPIYAFVQNGEARVKRIERPSADAIILISDNPDVAPELRSGAEAEQMQLAIIGKVVWSGHTVSS